jgi:threonine synthase
MPAAAIAKSERRVVLGTARPVKAATSLRDSLGTAAIAPQNGQTSERTWRRQAAQHLKEQVIVPPTKANGFAHDRRERALL